MRPLVYGCVSVPAHVAEEQAERRRWEIATFAEREGLALAGIFTDPRGRSQHAFYAMTEALRRGDATQVVVPAVEHLDHVPGLQHADVSAAARHVGAPILAVHTGDRSRTSRRWRRLWGRSARQSP